jgi:hypothetical protein
MSPEQPENLTQVQTVRQPDLSGDTSTGSPVITPGISITPLPVQEIRQRPNLNMERGKPFTITGMVNNRTITKVQVWLVNRSLTVRSIPVLADGTFMVVLSAGDTAVLPRDYTSALVIQYPIPPDNFTVTLDESSGKVTTTADVPPRILSEINDKGYYPTTLVDYLDQAITQYGNENSCDIYFPNGIDAWITPDPVPPGPPGTMMLTGNTSLPVGTILSLSVVTASTHPTPKDYDYSHEIASSTAVVLHGPFGINRFSGTVDTSRLNTGRYTVIIDTNDENLQASADESADIIAPASTPPVAGNYINWSALPLPHLVLNKTMVPVMLEGEWTIVPFGTQLKNNDVPYGSLIDCGPDAVCRVFDKTGVQVLAVYNSNEAHMMGVPNGAVIDSGSIGNVTLIKLNGETILIKIDEYSETG